LTAIFINYRSQGEAYAAALLDERLARRFGSDQVFRASRSISAGEDYELAILNAVERCRVMLVVIGPDWSRHFAEDGDTDWVRQEISKAMTLETPIIPVLLSGTDRVRAANLPSDLAKLARVQYLRFDYRNLDQDTEKIAQEVARSVSPPKRRRIFRRSRSE
jgi:hypothetical protein